MPKLPLNVADLAVESFEAAPDPCKMEFFYPRTREPGCTLPELCGTAREI
jgi:hypothetical protein